MNNQYKAIICMFATIILLTPNCALGEWIGDIYIGMHYSQADDMSIKFNGATVTTSPDTDTGSIFGGRIGYWFESNSRLGLAVDASVSQLDFNDIDISIGSFSTLFMVRLFLYSSEVFPKGRIQPYLGVGPGIYFGGMSEFIEEIPPGGSVLDGTYNCLGIDVRCGIYVLIKTSYGVFLEYGFKSFSPSFDSNAPGGNISLEPTFSTQNFLVGISFRF